jgi:hypothetical protein
MEWTPVVVAVRLVFPGMALGESATEEIIPMTEGLCRSKLEVGDDNSSGWGGRDKVCNEGSLWGF